MRALQNRKLPTQPMCAAIRAPSFAVARCTSYIRNGRATGAPFVDPPGVRLSTRPRRVLDHVQSERRHPITALRQAREPHRCTARSGIAIPALVRLQPSQRVNGSSTIRMILYSPLWQNLYANRAGAEVSARSALLARRGSGLILGSQLPFSVPFKCITELRRDLPISRQNYGN